MLRSRLTSALLRPRRGLAALSSSAASGHAWEPIEAKWQKRWAAQRSPTTLPAAAAGAATASGKDTFYCLAMFPYPSGTANCSLYCYPSRSVVLYVSEFILVVVGIVCGRPAAHRTCARVHHQRLHCAPEAHAGLRRALEATNIAIVWKLLKLIAYAGGWLCVYVGAAPNGLGRVRPSSRERCN